MKKMALLAFTLICMTMNVFAEETTTGPSYPPETSVERNERLTKLYKSFTGTYEGAVQFTKGSPQQIEFSLKVYVEEAEMNGEKVPVLLAYYQRADDERKAITLVFDVRIDRAETPAKIEMVSRPFPGPPNQYKLSLTGVFTKGGFAGKMNDFFQNRVGDVVLKKVKN